MIDKTNKHKKGRISEEDISTLLQRYTATTVLALLQEVAQCEGVKIDWNALVKKTATGISNVREYQMIWRHLAYRHAFFEKLEDGAQPLDDDSDLEYELEAFPEVSGEASTEAAACVKVLIASGLPSDSSHPNNTTVEAPLVINIPNGQPVKDTSEISQPAAMRGMNITVPVSVQKQPLPAPISVEVLEANGSTSGTIPPRRKRKPWSEAEDMELIAAVQKFGEGNWANIVRGDFNWDRTAPQLSQRWAIIRKRHCNLNVGSNSSGLQLSEAQRAARHAMSLALDPPPKNTNTNSSGGITLNNMSTNSVPPAAIAEASAAKNQSQQRPILGKTSSIGLVSTSAKSQVVLKRKTVKPNLTSDSIRAAAVAAGARIATQSDAASLINAFHAKSTVHIMPTGSSSIKSSVPGGVVTHSDVHSHVHFISTGLASTPLSTHLAVSSSDSHPGLVKASSLATKHAPSACTTLNISSQQTNAELPAKQDAKTVGGIRVSGSEDVTKEQFQEDGYAETLRRIKVSESEDLANEQVQEDGCSKTVGEIKVSGSEKQEVQEDGYSDPVGKINLSGSEIVAKAEGQEAGVCVTGNEPSKQVEEDRSNLLNQELELKRQVAIAENSNASLMLGGSGSDLVEVIGNQVDGCQNENGNNDTLLPAKGENQSVTHDNGDPSTSDKLVDLASREANESVENLEALSKAAEPGNGMLMLES